MVEQASPTESANDGNDSEDSSDLQVVSPRQALEAEYRNDDVGPDKERHDETGSRVQTRLQEGEGLGLQTTSGTSWAGVRAAGGGLWVGAWEAGEDGGRLAFPCSARARTGCP